MSQAASKRFTKFAKTEKLDVTRGLYGEWLNADTRRAWYYWFVGWNHRQQYDKKKRAASKPGEKP